MTFNRIIGLIGDSKERHLNKLLNAINWWGHGFTKFTFKVMGGGTRVQAKIREIWLLVVYAKELKNAMKI